MFYVHCLFSSSVYTCSYELAERAEELGVITSVVGAHDLVSRVSWRALSYLKLLVRKALDETSIKKASSHYITHVNVPRAFAFLQMTAYMYMYACAVHETGRVLHYVLGYCISRLRDVVLCMCILLELIREV